MVLLSQKVRVYDEGVKTWMQEAKEAVESLHLTSRTQEEHSEKDRRLLKPQSCPLWHTLSNNAASPDLSQTFIPTGEQVFKHGRGHSLSNRHSICPAVAAIAAAAILGCPHPDFLALRNSTDWASKTVPKFPGQLTCNSMTQLLPISCLLAAYSQFSGLFSTPPPVYSSTKGTPFLKTILLPLICPKCPTSYVCSHSGLRW